MEKLWRSIKLQATSWVGQIEVMEIKSHESIHILLEVGIIQMKNFQFNLQ